MIQIEKLGIFLSKPIAVVLVLIYLLQSGLLAYFVMDKYDLEKQIRFQQSRIAELQEKLQILKAIEDFNIGFTDGEVRQLADVVYTESKKYSYDPMFILAIILTESSLRKWQVSEQGARGLMQVQPFVAKAAAGRAGIDWMGPYSLFESETNVKLGTYYLFEQILKFGDINKALVAYNMGETRLRGLIKENRPLPRAYLKRVWDNYTMLKETYQV
jgi:soluble lytic murein transglycosylase